MEQTETVFLRTEKKYLISEATAAELMKRIEPYLGVDPYGEGEVCSLYFDTPDFRVIRHSIEHPAYKAKLRLRSYGVPDDETTVFLELKEKLGETVYKRREPMTLKAAKAFVSRNEFSSDSQIVREADWLRRSEGGMMPMIYIAYRRAAYLAVSNPNLRITFDRNVVFRRNDLRLEAGVRGERLLEKNVILEIKNGLAMPLWLTSALSATSSLPSSFSKYGVAYQQHIITEAKQYA